MTPELLDSTSAPSGSNRFTTTEAFDSTRPTTELRLPDGRLLRVPTALLLEQFSVADSLDAGDSQVSMDGAEPIAIPVIEEQLHVGKRSVVTGTVRLDKHVGVYEEALDIPLAIRSFDVERVVLNQPVEAAPAVRQEGDTTIYPLVEEQLVLTKQLIVREELRVTRRDTERRDTRTVSLRRESIEVTRG